MQLKLAFDHEFFEHVNATLQKENNISSKTYGFIAAILKYRIIILLLWAIENFLALLLTLPIPIYASVVYRLVNSSRGLPNFKGMYFRALYYRYRLKYLGRNVLIDQDVFFAFPNDVILSDFSYIDKNVTLMARTVEIGKRVHLAPNVFVSGGGHFVAEDFSCVATKSSIITSTETLKNGSRSSGPMVPAVEREWIRGKVILRKDAFVGAGVIILPNVIVGAGSVIAAGTTITKSTEPWSITASAKNNVLGYREKVKY